MLWAVSSWLSPFHSSLGARFHLIIFLSPGIQFPKTYLFYMFQSCCGAFVEPSCTQPLEPWKVLKVSSYRDIRKQNSSKRNGMKGGHKACLVVWLWQIQNDLTSWAGKSYLVLCLTSLSHPCYTCVSRKSFFVCLFITEDVENGQTNVTVE